MLPSGIVLQKYFLVLYAVALAAVPVLVAHGKAGVKGCDFIVIAHVHIPPASIKVLFTVKIMHSNGQNRIRYLFGISSRSYL